MTDPSNLSLLPPELFSIAFSFLSTASLARTSSICRTWRQDILSNPNLHTQLDLSRLARRIDATDYIRLLSRLSSYSGHRLTHVTLDVGVISNRPNVVSAERRNDILLSICVLLSKSKLSIVGLNIKLTKDHVESDVMTLLENLKPLEHSSSLKKSITIQIPCIGDAYFRIESQDGKQNVFVDNGLTESRIDSTLTQIRVMEKCKEVMQNCDFTMIRIPPRKVAYTGRIPVEQRNRFISQSIIRFLSRSKLSLKTVSLSLSSRVEETFKILLQCPELKSLFLGLVKAGDVEGVEPEPIRISIPEGTPRSSTLKNLSLGLDKGFDLDWDSLTDWIGEGLEQLSLEPLSGQDGIEVITKPPFLITSIDLFELLVRSKETLESINLTAVGEVDAQFGVNRKLLKDTAFTHLQNLSLNSVAEEVYDIFTHVSLPNLKRLRVGYRIFRYKDPRKAIQTAFDFLLKMMKRYPNQLRFIKFDSAFTFFPIMNQKKSKVYGTVEELDFGSRDRISDHVAELFSRFEFPNLKRLSTASITIRSKFRETSSLLPERLGNQGFRASIQDAMFQII